MTREHFSILRIKFTLENRFEYNIWYRFKKVNLTIL